MTDNNGFPSYNCFRAAVVLFNVKSYHDQLILAVDLHSFKAVAGSLVRRANVEYDAGLKPLTNEDCQALYDHLKVE